MKDLSKFTDQQLRDELSKRGYAVDGTIWQVGDVQFKIDEYDEENGTNIVVPFEEQLEIINQAISGDAIYIDINEAIEELIEDLATDLNK